MNKQVAIYTARAYDARFILSFQEIESLLFFFSFYVEVAQHFNFL